MSNYHVAVIGAGAAGLMAADRLSATGCRVDIYDAMPSAGRKILMAGKSGLNLSHNEELGAFIGRYGDQSAWITPMIEAFDAAAVRQWALDLGVETFVGSSGRIFPTEMKAAPLLRAWIRRMRLQNVQFHMRHQWVGFDHENAFLFQTPSGDKALKADAVLLATGGASWKRLGSDGAGVAIMAQKQVKTAPFRPANCGFDVSWSSVLRERFQGEPVKSVRLLSGGVQASGDFVISENGIEGSAVYAVSASLRDRLASGGPDKVCLHIDLAPDRSFERLHKDLVASRGKKSLSNWLRSKAGLSPVKIALLREVLSSVDMQDMTKVAKAIKDLPLPVNQPRPLDEAISVAGGIDCNALDKALMVKDYPGIFAAGEMLDWEAPTGGYLLTACFAQGWHAANGIMQWLENR